MPNVEKLKELHDYAQLTALLGSQSENLEKNSLLPKSKADRKLQSFQKFGQIQTLKIGADKQLYYSEIKFYKKQSLERHSSFSKHIFTSPVKGEIIQVRMNFTTLEDIQSGPKDSDRFSQLISTSESVSRVIDFKEVGPRCGAKSRLERGSLLLKQLFFNTRKIRGKYIQNSKSILNNRAIYLEGHKKGRQKFGDSINYLPNFLNILYIVRNS